MGFFVNSCQKVVPSRVVDGMEEFIQYNTRLGDLYTLSITVRFSSDLPSPSSLMDPWIGVGKDVVLAVLHKVYLVIIESSPVHQSERSIFVALNL